LLHADAIKDHARSLGFDLCGIAPAAALPELAHLPDWLARGYAGEMIYLHKSAHVRADIRNFLPSARSVIVTGTVYNTDEGNRPFDSAQGRQKAEGKNGPSDPIDVARYARGQDYHVVLAGRLEALLAWMREQQRAPFDAAIFVDKHQVQERPYARHAGIGWIGKNTCVINPELGSFLFLAGLAVDLALDIDAPSLDQCGACTLCIDACPTGALVDAHVLDATRCISYLTIETAGALAPDQRPQIANHAYGCDICQDVCPWNLAGPRSHDPAWHAVPRHGLSAAALWQQTDNELHQWVAGSAMTHLSLSGLRRNLATVIGNSGNPDLSAALDRPGRGIKNAAHSAHTPTVEDAVAWARVKLKPSNPRALKS
jgi:epoxyqueuosine reductase